MSEVQSLERVLSPFLDVLSLTKELVRRPSLTPDDADCQAIITARLKSLGFSCEQIDFGKTKNLWATRGAGAPLFVFVGHTDVVPPGPEDEWGSPPFEPFEKEGSLFGRGAADMKGAIAAFLVAVERFVSSHWHHPGTLAILLTSDEEGSGADGVARALAVLKQRGIKIDFCLVGEPISEQTTGDTVKVGSRGVLNGRLFVMGKEGHVAYPRLARNPIHEIAAPLAELAGMQWDLGNEHFPPTSFQITNVRAGNGTENSIPGVAEAWLNFRFCPESSVEKLQSSVDKVLSRYDIDFRVDWKLHGKPFFTPNRALVAAALRAVLEVTGQKPQLSTLGGTSDGRHIAETGAEVVEIGLTNKTIHKVNECIRVNELESLVRIYERVLQHLFGEHHG